MIDQLNIRLDKSSPEKHVYTYSDEEIKALIARHFFEIVKDAFPKDQVEIKAELAQDAEGKFQAKVFIR